MAGADGRKRDPARCLQIHDAAPGEVAFERARSLLLDLRPRHLRNRGELAVQVVHDWGFPFSEPMPSEPSDSGGIACGDSKLRTGEGWDPVGASGVTSSRNVAVGAKKRLPVTARLKSRIRS